MRGKWRVSRNHERIVISVIRINDIRPVFSSITAEKILASALYRSINRTHEKRGLLGRNIDHDTQLSLAQHGDYPIVYCLHESFFQFYAIVFSQHEDDVQQI